MTQFEWDVLQIAKHNKDAKINTHAERARSLLQMGRELVILNYGKKLKATNLKPHHLDDLIKHWQEKGISKKVLNNRLAHLRWLCKKIGKPGLIANSNSKYTSYE